ncbi:hypothetical protein [Vibrio coralliilyticus]|uniref:hypothetical protein n=1 Tax=Vibrio coralliilyticus TaxID=190893 RepID=UPI001E4B1BBD|nr:hypothetical protein [Vibrio coralliilyticus]MCC2521065.1 hypothetical protein [Vibrio coralliilyticus]
MILLLQSLILMMGCSSLTRPLPNWPQNLNVIELSDGGVCLDKGSAIRLAELKAQLEAM